MRKQLQQKELQLLPKTIFLYKCELGFNCAPIWQYLGFNKIFIIPSFEYFEKGKSNDSQKKTNYIRKRLRDFIFNLVPESFKKQWEDVEKMKGQKKEPCYVKPKDITYYGNITTNNPKLISGFNDEYTKVINQLVFEKGYVYYMDDIALKNDVESFFKTQKI